LSLESLVAIALPASVVGIGGGLLTNLIELGVFYPRLPAEFKKMGAGIKLWKRALTPLYGGIVEEILLRLFVMSGLIWLLSRFNNGSPSDAAVWFAIVLAALLFGIGHLPATVSITPLTPLIVSRALLLNGILGVAAGYLFWRYGLESAMIAHAWGDIFIIVLPSFFIRPQKDDLVMKPQNTLKHPRIT
jgi:hypothetical protein